MNYLFLLDGNNLAIRSYFSQNSTPKDSIRSVINSISKNINLILPEFNSDVDKFRLILTVDNSKAKETRRKIYPEYKEGREKDSITNPLFFIELDEIRNNKTFETVPVMSSETIEADDIIANLCWKYSNAEKIIFSNDKDFFGLIDEKTKIFRDFPSESNLKFKMKEIYDLQKLKTQFGDSVYQNNINAFYILKALIGDSSDNIKGVKKVGEKTSIKFLNEIGEFHSLREAKDKMIILLKEKYSEDEIKNFNLALKLVCPIYLK